MSEATMEIVNNTEAAKPYTFRRLAATDVFLMSKIIGKIGVNEFAACFDRSDFMELVKKSAKKGDTLTKVGLTVALEIANVIFSHLPKCEDDIYQMLSNTTGMTVNEVKALDFIVFTEMVIDFIKKEEFRDFLKVVSKLFN